MFFIPGFLISLVTFPGVIVHEIAHQLFCRWFKVPVFEVCYFRLENPCGYVIHEIPSSKIQSIMISIGPFIVNTLIGFLIALPAVIPVFMTNNPNTFNYILIYLGVSIAMHAFPSKGDANAILEAIKEDDTPLAAKIIAYPVVGFIYLGSIGSFFWLDLIYGIAVCVWLPKYLMSLLA